MRGDREFRKVRTHGQMVRHRLFGLRITDYRPRYGEQWRPRAIIGIVVSKKTLKRAVDRNRVRRRVREALRTLPTLPPCRAILTPNADVLRVPFAELQTALAASLGRAELKGAARGRNRTPDRRVSEAVKPTSPGQP
ncbi:ribonuclease P protein component [Deinococcus sonorensis]|uniref:Ribonuclease P protein component n=2 Tax=Deinococcus sonorensis TaxID=309891 RepID=A0AAU7UFE0_9DEIO